MTRGPNDVEAALRRLGQPATDSVLAEEMGCSESDFPSPLIQMLVDRGETFTWDGPHSGAWDGYYIGLLEWQKAPISDGQ